MLSVFLRNFDKFSRGYCFPQFQLDAGHVYNMTKYEYESQQSWIVFSSDQLSITTAALHLLLGQRQAWDYNVPINLAEIKDTSMFSGQQHCRPCGTAGAVSG